MFNFFDMKILNNDIKDLNAWLLRWCHTLWDNLIIDNIIEEAVGYLQKKYNKNICELDEWLDESLIYFNNLNEQEYIELFKYTKDLFLKNFWEEKWLIFYIKLTFWLMEDWEYYSEVINGSKTINESLLKDYNNWFKYYAKNHKYRIWQAISHVCRNLWYSIKWLNKNNFYDFWENYRPN